MDEICKMLIYFINSNFNPNWWSVLSFLKQSCRKTHHGHWPYSRVTKPTFIRLILWNNSQEGAWRIIFILELGCV